MCGRHEADDSRRSSHRDYDRYADDSRHRRRDYDDDRSRDRSRDRDGHYSRRDNSDRYDRHSRYNTVIRHHKRAQYDIVKCMSCLFAKMLLLGLFLAHLLNDFSRIVSMQELQK